VPENAITWNRPETMHLTLAFLGDGNQPEQVAAVCDLLDTVTAGIKPFPLRLGAIGCFPRRRNPKVIHTGLQGGVKQLHTLKERLDLSLAQTGYVPEDRKYTPHLTLGRVRKPDQVEKAQLPFGSHTPPVDWHVSAIHLYHSFHTKKRGPQYKIIHSSQFKND
jgi:2'-5' RNA ligase